jgi:hypothetical protein
MKTHKSIRLYSHSSGSPKVSAPAGFDIESAIGPGEPTLDVPTALREADPGELVVIEDDQDRPQSPLILASKGRKVDLHDKQDLIEAAKGAGRAIELHVFDDLS